MADNTLTRAERQGMKTMVIFVPPEVSHKVKIAAAVHQSTVQKIGEQAVLQWLARYEANDRETIDAIAGADKRVTGGENPGRAMPEEIARKA